MTAETLMSEVMVLLASDAMEAAEQQPPLAAMLLIDAAVAILVCRLNGDGAREMANMLTEYLLGQTDASLKTVNGGGA